MASTLFNSPSNDKPLQFSEVILKIKKFLGEDSKASYKLTIGTDSEIKFEKGKESVLELISAIVIYRKGFGGRYFWTKRRMKTTKTLREKIYQEVLLSLEMAHLLVPTLKLELDSQIPYDLEIHIDVGDFGATRAMIREVVGLVTGNGFVAKTKPYSYAASNIADKHT